jgi:mono/diheme cytochrome c family protein
VRLVTRDWRLVTTVALATGVAVSAALFAQAPASGDAKAGRKLFAADGCYQCHGYEAQGAAPTGPRLGPKPIAFAQFQKYVRSPTGQMPPYTAKSIPDRDLADIYAFLQSLPAPPAVDAIAILR